MKKTKGVTLIALAVTIIVMLILAGVSISALTGNSGISKNAENARLQNELGSIVEKINFAISEAFMDDVNVDKMKVLIDKGYIIENKNENYDYVDASAVLGSSSKFGKGNDDKERYILDGNKVVYINNKGEEVTEAETALDVNKNFITTWRVNANDKIVLPFIEDQYFQGNYDCTIDWGDGSGTEHVGGKNSTAKRPEHIYSQAGDYNISISGKCSYFVLSSDDYSSTYPELLKKLIKIVSWGAVKAVEYEFGYAENLVEIAEPTKKTFIKCDDDSFAYMFSGCKNLEVIPSFLFRYVNENTTSFEGTFTACEKLTSVPEELFKNAPNATSFEETFEYCKNLMTIPTNLFANNKKINNFRKTFKGCTKLENVPYELFDSTPDTTNFDSTFYRCDHLKTGPKIWERANASQISENQRTYAHCNAFDKTGLSTDILNKYFK